jgi:hypothetical protein
MNNTFSIQRFGLLLKRQWLEFGKIYLISLLVALGVIIAFYTFSIWPTLIGESGFNERDLDFRLPLFIIFGFIFISIIASNYFAHLGQKPKAIIDLMIPASTFEKFLTGIFFTSILASVSFILIFYLTDLAFVSKLIALHQSSGSPISISNTNGKEIAALAPSYFFIENSELFEFAAVYIIPFFVTSIFMLGSIYFHKFHYIKTAISVMIFSGIWSAIIFKTGDLLFEGKIMIDQEERNNAMFSRLNIEILSTLLLATLTLIFLSITYVRLKEKEV